MSRLFSTEPTEYATDTDREFPGFAEKLRKLAPLADPPMSPTETDQFVTRWGTFLRANDVTLERDALGLFNGILKLRTEKDPDVLNLDPPSLHLRQRNSSAGAAMKVDDWVKGGAKTHAEDYGSAVIRQWRAGDVPLTSDGPFKE